MVCLSDEKEAAKGDELGGGRTLVRLEARWGAGQRLHLRGGRARPVSPHERGTGGFYTEGLRSDSGVERVPLTLPWWGRGCS